MHLDDVEDVARDERWIADGRMRKAV